MALTVKTPEKAEEIVQHILQYLLHNGRTKIQLKSKLSEKNLRNVTIHGYNIKNGGCFLTDNISSVIGTEIQVSVNPEMDDPKELVGEEKKKHKSQKEKKKREDTVKHTLYELERILHHKDIKKDKHRLAQIFFYTLGKFYQKICHFKKK